MADAIEIARKMLNSCPNGKRIDPYACQLDCCAVPRALLAQQAVVEAAERLARAGDERAAALNAIGTAHDDVARPFQAHMEYELALNAVCAAARALRETKR